jgi:hypothetical protein
MPGLFSFTGGYIYIYHTYGCSIRFLGKNLGRLGTILSNRQIFQYFIWHIFGWSTHPMGIRKKRHSLRTSPYSESLIPNHSGECPCLLVPIIIIIILRSRNNNKNSNKNSDDDDRNTNSDSIKAMHRHRRLCCFDFSEFPACSCRINGNFRILKWRYCTI